MAHEHTVTSNKCIAYEYHFLPSVFCLLVGNIFRHVLNHCFYARPRVRCKINAESPYRKIAHSDPFGASVIDSHSHTCENTLFYIFYLKL